jgi:hypothetical protein
MVAFVDRAPSYVEEELVPYRITSGRVDIGSDPLGFTNYDSAAKVFGTDFFAMPSFLGVSLRGLTVSTKIG